MGNIVKYSLPACLAIALFAQSQSASANWLQNGFKDVTSLILAAPKLVFPDKSKSTVSARRKAVQSQRTPSKRLRSRKARIRKVRSGGSRTKARVSSRRIKFRRVTGNPIATPLAYAPVNFDGLGEFLSAIGSDAAILPRELATGISGGAGKLFQSDMPLAAVATPLAVAIRHARDVHYKNAKPLPKKIIRLLAGILPRSTLKRARYVVGDFAITLPGVINGGHKFLAGNDHAMVVDDVIVFSTRPDMNTALGIRWWAHEIHHVYQYKVWGVDKFARNYVRDRGNIERRAERTAKKVLARFFRIAKRKKR